MSSSTPKTHKTPSQKSYDEKEKEKDKNQININKKNYPNYIERNEFNEKYFPQKTNFYIKEEKKLNAIQSPIINYFSPTSNDFLQKYNSPEEIISSNKSNPNTNTNNKSIKLSPNIEHNLNFSPSNIFNKNNINNSNNIKNEENKDNNDNETLQDRIGILLEKNDNNININNNINQKNNANNSFNNMNQITNLGGFNSNNYFNNYMNNINNNANSNNLNNNINEKNEEEFDNQDEVYILNFNSEDEKDLEDDNNINNNNNNNNIQNDNNNENNNINMENNNINNNKSTNEQLNNIIYTDDNKLPSYGGGALYQNQNQIFQNPIPNNNINKTTNNIYYPIMNNNIIYSPMNYCYFPYRYYNYENRINYYPNKIGEFMSMNNMNNLNNNIPLMNNNNNNNNNKIENNFFYNGDQYQIFNQNQNNINYNKNVNVKDDTKKKFQSKNNIQNNINNNQKESIYTIGPKDFVNTITSNNKKIKRVNPKIYLNESYEYLSHNIFILAKDQAGCRFLQEKIEKDPITATKYFYDAIQPYITVLVKDSFGNYLVQKIIKNLDKKKIQKILELISPNILEIGTNSHGTRVIQFLINYLKTPELRDYFVNMIKPYTIQLLKELNGTHIVQKLLLEFPDTCMQMNINKIIIENSASLATHRHGCCVLQKFIDGNYKKLQDELITNLINNCLVLIIDQFGNYVIQSILLLKDDKISTQIAKKINENLPYFSKHRYSSNVVEKCFDFCNQKDIATFIEKLSLPEIVAELILDDHGNYVIQKALQFADNKTKEKMLKIIEPMIPRIKEVSFGPKLLNRLFMSYPQLSRKNNNNIWENNKNNNSNNNEQNYKNRKNNKK